MVISALNSLETGHPALALLAAVLNAAWLAPGTFAFTSRCTLVMANPPSTLSRVTAAVVLMLSAVRLALPSCPLSAMEKHPACAAASNSSGFVPMPLSNRELKLYCVSFSTPLSVETVPFPSFSPPRQMALPFRCMTNHLHEILCDQKWYQTKLWRNGDAANEKGGGGSGLTSLDFGHSGVEEAIETQLAADEHNCLSENGRNITRDVPLCRNIFGDAVVFDGDRQLLELGFQFCGGVAGFTDLRIHLTAQQHRRAGEIKPKHQDDQCAQRSIGSAV